MQDDKYSLPQEKQNETSSDYLNVLQEENQKLILENTQLKDALEKEEFLHKNLYKQWTELNDRVLTRDRELTQLKLKQDFWRNFYRYSFYALLLTTIVFAYYSFTSGEKPTPVLQQVTNAIDTAVRPTEQRQQQQNPAKNIKPAKKDTIPPQLKQAPGNNESSETKIPEISKNPIQYRVKRKTFFYDYPDENTQRNTFLLPYKGSYGIIKALDDKNGFIYVVFINHAGRTSKGWIRKIDLDLVDQ